MIGRVRSMWGAGCLAGVAMLAACAPLKPPSTFEQDFEDRQKNWTEVEAQLPPAPRDDRLVAFGVSGGAQFRFALDAYTLSIGSDGVFRYVLVATSAGGSRNVSYEGIRCETGEKKVYAIGRPDGSWVRSRNAAWTKIEEVGNNRQHAALMKEYFCPEGVAARDTPTVVARMRPRVPPSEAAFSMPARDQER